MILAVAGLAIAVPVAFVSAEAGGGAGAESSKKRKKCKKHQKRVKGKCKRKGPGQGGQQPPAAQGGGPQFGDYAGDAVMKSFSVVPGPAGTQGRVYLFALAPSTATCIGPLVLSLSEKSSAATPVYVRNDEFSFSESGSGEGESSSVALNGIFTSPTTATGTIRFTLTGGGAADCDTGPLPFRVTKK